MLDIRKIGMMILVIALAFSCKRPLYSDSEAILARVGDEYLLISDISPSMPKNINKTDSIQMQNSMVENWVRLQLMLKYANRNLPDSLKDFSEQLNNYENNLLIYKYKERLVRQKLDTVIRDDEIEKYYQTHLKDFQLKENIIRFVYIKIPIQSEMVDEARRLVKNIADTSIDRSMVEGFCQQNAVDYFLNDEQWVPFNDLLQMTPIDAINQEVYLKNNRFIQIKDHPYWYFINLRDFKIKEEVSPLDFERAKVKNIILNQRKLNMLNKLEDDIYEGASAKHEFDIY